MKDKSTLHVVGHAHLDPVFLWTWEEGLQMAIATFKSALERMEEYKEFKFIASTAYFYEWIEGNFPSIFDEIRQRVKEGRWNIVGGWWVEADGNLPQGEALIRQGLYGQRYFLSRFSEICQIAFCPDTFGHSAALPQILKKSGFCGYCFMRPGQEEKELPDNYFNWEGIDGTTILACRLFKYNNEPEEKIVDYMRDSYAFKSPESKHGLCLFGVGNHGGGATRKNIESALDLMSKKKNFQIKFTSLDTFFSLLHKEKKNFPLVKDELQNYAQGCYTTNSQIKRMNRDSENLLLNAEKFSALAFIYFGEPYPLGELTNTWKALLFNHFHDIISGSISPQSSQNAIESFGRIKTVAGEKLWIALRTILSRINTRFTKSRKEIVQYHDNRHLELGDGVPVVVFNPCAFQRKVAVEVEFHDWFAPGLKLIDDQRKKVEVQFVSPDAFAAAIWIKDRLDFPRRKRIVFVAELPSLGYRVFRASSEEDGISSFPPDVEKEVRKVASKRWEMEFTEQGGIKRLYDKINKVEVFFREGNILHVLNDPSDTWGHDVRKFDKLIGRFKATSIKLIEDGPVRSRLRLYLTYNKSSIEQDIIIYSELSIIEFRNTLIWQEKNRMVKVAFPIEMKDARLTSEIPCGTIERPLDSYEYPCQNWIDVSGQKEKGIRYGMSLLNNGKYGYDASKESIRLTLTRSPRYAMNMTDMRDPDKPEQLLKEPYPVRSDYAYRYMDIGRQEFSYYLYPHKGDWQEAKTTLLGQSLNNPPIPHIEFAHKGNLPKKKSFLTVKPDNVIVTALKKSEDDGSLILRCYESMGVDTKAEVFFGEKKWNFNLGKYEIKTFRINLSPFKVREVNLLEFTEEEMQKRMTNG